MTDLSTSQDIINDALFRAGEPIDGTSDFQAQALNHLNRVYRAVWVGGRELLPSINEVWWWLQAEGSLILQPSYKTGTASVTNNSTTVTLSTPPTTTRAGWFFKVDNHNDFFIVSSDDFAAAGSTITLDTVYTGDTNATASFRLMKLAYDLPADFMKMAGEMVHYRNTTYDENKIYGMSLRTMEEKYPLVTIIGGPPRAFAFTDSDSIRFSHYGDDNGDLIRVDFDYLKRPDHLENDASSVPLMPIEYRTILADYATAMVMEDKNDDRGQSALALARTGMKAMQRENRQRMSAMGEPGRIYSRADEWARHRRVLKTESGLVLSG
jgi:hypothetical protein